MINNPEKLSKIVDTAHAVYPLMGSSYSRTAFRTA